MRGRKPKPSWLKVVTGNPGKRPLNRAEPQPDGDLKEPPHWFTARQRIIWDVCIANAPAGLLKLIDSTVLEAFVVAKSLHEDAALKIAQYGSVVRLQDSGGHTRSPYVGILNQQAAVMLKCAAEMGFTPSSRSRVKVDGGKKGPNPFADLKELADE
jgi:P27 family predicted phage terminase small subunit